jgi:cystathionine beta-lyase/cystathionine gamma-synthase
MLARWGFTKAGSLALGLSGDVLALESRRRSHAAAPKPAKATLGIQNQPTTNARVPQARENARAVARW